MTLSTVWILVAAAEILSLHFCSTALVEHPVAQSQVHLDVEQLIGVADFRSVRLSWKYPAVVHGDTSRPPIAFIVRHCEMVVWRRDKCMSHEVNVSTAEMPRKPSNDVNLDIEPDGSAMTAYETVIDGLRLATNYSFEVHPLMDVDVDAESEVGPQRDLSMVQPLLNARSLERNELIVATKAFSARPRTCLGDRTEVDIETGPNFAGHVSVEGAYDRRCTWIGDERETEPVHTFVIDHRLCGGGLKEGRIETIVIVSESRTIITHTARRFMVVCNLVPETYTIKASINIPNNAEAIKDESNNPNDNPDQVPGNSVDSELSYEEIFPLGRHPNNRRISSQHTAELRQMAQLLEGNRNDTTAAHLILMVVLVVSVSVGTVATAWWFIAQRSRAGRFDLSAAEYEERLPSCRNVVVMTGKTSNDPTIAAVPAGCCLDVDESDQLDIDGHQLRIDYGRQVDSWRLKCPSSSSAAHAVGDRLQLGKSCSMPAIEPSNDDLCATTLVLAPSITAAFQSSGDSCC